MSYPVHPSRASDRRVQPRRNLNGSLPTRSRPSLGGRDRPRSGERMARDRDLPIRPREPLRPGRSTDNLSRSSNNLHSRLSRPASAIRPASAATRPSRHSPGRINRSADGGRFDARSGDNHTRPVLHRRSDPGVPGRDRKDAEDRDRVDQGFSLKVRIVTSEKTEQKRVSGVSIKSRLGKREVVKVPSSADPAPRRRAISSNLPPARSAPLRVARPAPVRTALRAALRGARPAAKAAPLRPVPTRATIQRAERSSPARVSKYNQDLLKEKLRKLKSLKIKRQFLEKTKTTAYRDLRELRKNEIALERKRKEKKTISGVVTKRSPRVPSSTVRQRKVSSGYSPQPDLPKSNIKQVHHLNNFNITKHYTEEIDVRSKDVFVTKDSYYHGDNLPSESRHPPKERSSPKERRSNPKERRSSPKDRRCSPKERRSSPKERRSSPKERRSSPKDRRGSPKDRRGSPKAVSKRRKSEGGDKNVKRRQSAPGVSETKRSDAWLRERTRMSRDEPIKSNASNSVRRHSESGRGYPRSPRDTAVKRTPAKSSSSKKRSPKEKSYDIKRQKMLRDSEVYHFGSDISDDEAAPELIVKEEAVTSSSSSSGSSSSSDSESSAASPKQISPKQKASPRRPKHKVSPRNKISPRKPRHISSSKWCSDSDSDAVSIHASPRVHHLPTYEHNTLSRYENNDGRRGSSPERMFRQRMCHLCHLQLKTMDDVKRHVLSQRHQIITGEFFHLRPELLRVAGRDDEVICTICNSVISRSVSQHERQGLHKEMMTRWTQRKQPLPPVPYYLHKGTPKKEKN